MAYFLRFMLTNRQYNFQNVANSVLFTPIYVHEMPLSWTYSHDVSTKCHFSGHVYCNIYIELAFHVHMKKRTENWGLFIPEFLHFSVKVAFEHVHFSFAVYFKFLFCLFYCLFVRDCAFVH